MGEEATYEYDVVPVGRGKRAFGRRLVEVLNEAAENGWEFVAVVQHSEGGKVKDWVVMKR